MPIIQTIEMFKKNTKASSMLINNGSFDFVTQINWFDYTSAYQIENFVKPLCLSMLDEINRLKEELVIIKDARFARQMALDEMYKYHKFDKATFENDLMANGNYIQSCLGDLLKIK